MEARRRGDERKKGAGSVSVLSKLVSWQVRVVAFVLLFVAAVWLVLANNDWWVWPASSTPAMLATLVTEWI